MRLPAIPVTPDGDDARGWAEDELSKQVYQAAEPTLLDRIAGAIRDWFTDLLGTTAGAAWSPLLYGVIAVIVIALIIVAVLVWGRPRGVVRSRANLDHLFGESDVRTADALRRAADASASAGDWDTAVIERVRAIARSLDERGVLHQAPGTTVQAFARDASTAFPTHEAGLTACATTFDDVRYLRRSATEAMYAVVRGVDDAVRGDRPVALAPLIGSRA